MPARNPRCLLPILLLCYIGASGQTLSTRTADLNDDRILSAAKTYLRDVGEFPMNATVTVDVIDTSGRLKQRLEGTVRFVFHGYNSQAQSGAFSLFFSKGENRVIKEGAMTGGDAVLAAGMKLRTAAATTAQIRRPDRADQPLAMSFHEHGCPEFGRSEARRDAGNFCGRVEYGLVAAHANDLRLQHFSLDCENLPAKATTAALGNVNMLSYHVEEDFAETFVPGDPVVFLVPRQNVTTMRTNKGEIIVKNQYTAERASTPERH